MSNKINLFTESKTRALKVLQIENYDGVESVYTSIWGFFPQMDSPEKIRESTNVRIELVGHQDDRLYTRFYVWVYPRTYDDMIEYKGTEGMGWKNFENEYRSTLLMVSKNW